MRRPPPQAVAGHEQSFVAFSYFLESGRTILSLIRTPHGNAPAHGPPLWEAVSEEHASTPDPAPLPTPAFEFDQRLTW